MQSQELNEGGEDDDSEVRADEDVLVGVAVKEEVFFFKQKKAYEIGQ